MERGQEHSLIEAYLMGFADLVVWLFPAIVTGLVVTLSQRVLLSSPTNSEEPKK